MRPCEMAARLGAGWGWSGLLDEEAFEALLLQAYDDETAAVLAAVVGREHLELVGALLKRGADVHAKTLDGFDAC